ncbi:MAG: hypothetical protein Q4F84_06335 [Fibrobacter sp.]|nr:hypothetical protein [Fibrobacter sp.]
MNVRFAVFCFMLAACVCAEQDFDINGFGKKIQTDGFLMEWNSSTVKKWDRDSLWYWDAINTSSGVSGYIRSKDAVKCSSWVFVVDPYGDNETFSHNISIPQDSATEFYSLDYQAYDSLGQIVFEWTLPWESIEADADGAYSIRVAARSECGDSLSSMLLIGSKKKSGRYFIKEYISKIIQISIVILAMVFVRSLIRRMTRNGRKVSPRR